MKKYAIVCAGLCLAMAFTSCKSGDSAYKQAYMKAKQQEEQQQQQQQQQQQTSTGGGTSGSSSSETGSSDDGGADPGYQTNQGTASVKAYAAK